MMLEWRRNPEHPDTIEVFVDNKMVAWLCRRPHYCDRGHWQAQVELEKFSIDAADAFPRYFMRFETAKQELEDFLKWRLWKIPAPCHHVEPLVPAVHALLYGHPLCRFSSAVPAEWPEGQTWVGRNEIDKVTCPRCKYFDAQMKLEKHYGNEQQN